MKQAYRLRRIMTALIVFSAIIASLATHPSFQQVALTPPDAPMDTSIKASGDAAEALENLPIKGRAAKTGYARTQFGDGWQSVAGCDTRNIILNRDLLDVRVDDTCRVLSGTLNDPYTGNIIIFTRGESSSQAVQIDHVVALSNAWQTGAQGLTPVQRVTLANDPLELLAVDGASNQQKSDGDAATWLPPNKSFRCQYVARQIAVKLKYQLWVTSAEKDAMTRVLRDCPGQALPSAS